LGSPDLNPLDYNLWGVLADMACCNLTTTWTACWDPSWKRQRSLWRQCVPRWQIGRSVSRLAPGQRVAILSDIIINRTFKLVLINYVSLTVDVLFHLPSRSQNPWNRSYGKTRYKTK
jgi:hypothetical protein